MKVGDMVRFQFAPDRPTMEGEVEAVFSEIIPSMKEVRVRLTTGRMAGTVRVIPESCIKEVIKGE